MFKLTVVSGPGRGAEYRINQGESALGRVEGCEIQIASSRISKKHCVLVVEDEKITLRDEGSRNGTFVNGALINTKEIKSGDRISVGDVVLELSEYRKKRPSTSSQSVNNGDGGQVLSFPGGGFPPSPSDAFGGQLGIPAAGVTGELIGASSSTMSNMGMPSAGDISSSKPQDLKAKVLDIFENQIMSFFYTSLEKNQFRNLFFGICGLFIVISLMLSIAPLVSSSQEMIVRELSIRARIMARELVDKNQIYLAAGQETKTDIGSLGKDQTVRFAAITDLDGRILAPAEKLNQYINTGVEGRQIIRAKKEFMDGREKGIISGLENDTVVAIEPVKVYSPQAGKNFVAGLAVVSIDAAQSTLDYGKIGVIYSQSLVVTALLGFVLFAILFRLTLKPFENLNLEIDQVLKGDLGDISRKFKMDEMLPLFDVISSALQRLPKAGSDGNGSDQGPSLEDLSIPFKSMAHAGVATCVCDAERKIIFMSTEFEAVTGIRMDQAMGQMLTQMARDQAFSAYVTDIFDRSIHSTEGFKEDFEFSGVAFHGVASILGNSMNVKGYSLIFLKPGNSES